MKTLTPTLTAHLARETLTLATCWRVTRRDGAVLCFTDHDRDIALDGRTHAAASGFTPAAVQDRADLSVDNLELDGVLDAAMITEADISAGRYDGATVEIFQVNWQSPADGTLPLRSGTLGAITRQGGRFVAEVRGLTQAFSQTLGASYGPGCRASLGDARCGVALSAYTVSGTLDAAPAAAAHTQLVDSARTEPAGFFSGGLFTFTGGANDGIALEVREYAPGTLRLVLPPPYPAAAGDTYTLQAGCDKTLATCAGRFGNAVNFRGEPHLPGLDKLLQTAGTRTRW